MRISVKVEVPEGRKCINDNESACTFGETTWTSGSRDEPTAKARCRLFGRSLESMWDGAPIKCDECLRASGEKLR